MERVETLLKKLQNQFAQHAPANQLLLTVQMLQAELQCLQQNSNGLPDDTVIVTVPPVNPAPAAAAAKTEIIPPGEKIIEVLQVDEAEIEAELEEIKRNAETIQQMSVQHKPHIIFEPDEDIPTLTNRKPATAPGTEKTSKEINDAVSTPQPSLNDKLKQSSIDLGETLTGVPIRDLRKAIALNDRFVFINELFRGDEAAYERSIKTINSFSIFAEAEYWILRELKVKNGWEMDHPTVMHFFQLVKRRFS